jgi:outer membrane protein
VGVFFGSCLLVSVQPKKSLSEGVKMRTTKCFLAVGILVVVVLVTAAYGADVAKIGVIDMQRVLETSSAGKAALSEIKQQRQEMESALQRKKEEIEQLRKQLERDAMVLSREKREEKEREGRIKINDIKTMQKRYVAELKQQEKKHLQRMQKAVYEIIEQIGKKEGYLLIVNKAGVLYSPMSTDITDQLIKEYNIKFAKTPGQDAKKGKE